MVTWHAFLKGTNPIAAALPVLLVAMLRWQMERNRACSFFPLGKGGKKNYFNLHKGGLMKHIKSRHPTAPGGETLLLELAQHGDFSFEIPTSVYSFDDAPHQLSSSESSSSSEHSAGESMGLDPHKNADNCLDDGESTMAESPVSQFLPQKKKI